MRSASKPGNSPFKAKALKALEEPAAFPDELEGLLKIARAVHGREPEGRPCSNTELEAYCRLRGVVLDEKEVDAVMLLDSVLNNPTAYETKDD